MSSAEIVAALRGARARILELEGRIGEPIAVVGRAARFAGAETLEAFAEAARSGRSGVASVPPERWWGRVPSDPTFVARGAMLSDPFRFDAEAFGIPAAEAAGMDPQQRMALELGAEALERAGWDRAACAGAPIGVFLGVCNNDYAQRFLSRDPDRNDGWVGTGNAFSVASGRIAYALGLKGPALTVDTACSSSLVAVHLACQSLRARECDVALAGGVNVILLPALSAFFGRMGFLSRSGVGRPFDARADGYVRGEGGGAVVLRRLSDARAAGDPLLAVIRGTALNQSGHRNGLVAPNRAAQEAVMRQALAVARIEPGAVGYVEAMGVGSPLADLVEATAIRAVYGAGRSVPVASIKGQIGHCEAAAGIASLLRAIEAVRGGWLPPTAGFERAARDLEGVAARSEASPWEGPRTAAVSAFGFSGTNAHLLVEEASGGRAERAVRPWGGRQHRADVEHPGAERGPEAAPCRTCAAAGAEGEGCGCCAPGQAERAGKRAKGPEDSRGNLEEICREEWARQARNLGRAGLGSAESGVMDLLSAEVGAILGRPVDPDAPLSELGLDSLSAVELVRRLQERAGILVYPGELVRAESLRALAGAISAPRAQEGARDAFLAARARLGARRWDGRAEPRSAGSPVFLLSPPRAGSTLLRVLLGGHPEVFAPPELHLLPFSELGERREALGPALLDVGLLQALIGAGVDPEEARRRTDAWADARRPVTEAYEALLEGGRVLVDKSPSYAFDPAVLERAERLFRAPRYLVLTRHPGAVRASFSALRMGRLLDVPSGLPEGEAAWLTAMEHLDLHLARVPSGRVHRVRYEDLVRDPERTLSGITRWLGLRWDDRMLAPWHGDPARMAGDHGFVGDPNFRLRGRLDPRLRSPFGPGDPPLEPETAARAWGWGYAPDPETAAAVAATGRRVEHGVVERAASEPVSVAPPGDWAPGGSVLLTGATGFLGPWLLRALLARHDGPVEVLVRAPDERAARARLGPDLDERVRVHAGDLEAPGLGIRDRRGLCGRLLRVVHSGAVVSFVQPFSALAPANVEGTRAVLALCRDAGAPLLHVSTKGVYGAWAGEGPIPEEAAVPPPFGGTGYQASKWAAEALVADSGLPAGWVRVGRIGGDTGTGRAPADDLFVRFVRACLEIEMAPDLPGRFEVLPVDVVADALAGMALADARGPTLLVHPDPRPLPELVGALSARIPIVLYPRWRERLVARFRGGGGALDPLLSLFPPEPPARLDDGRLVPERLLASGFSPEPVAETLRRMFAG